MKKIILGGLFFAFTLISCEKHPAFKTSIEAIEACKKELDNLSSKTSVDTKELVNLTNEWIEIRDSSYSVFAKDPTMTIKSDKSYAYFMLSDSIRKKLEELAISKDRTLEDVMYLKLNTAAERNKVSNSKTYQEAVDFYESLDDISIYTSLAKTLQEYDLLLKNTGILKKENQLLEFIKTEDRCYRSLMANLSQVTQAQLEKLTNRTARIISVLYANVGKKNNDANDKAMLYLTMRFNRRIVQNMVACREDIVNEKKLNNTQRANYRWMLIQSYMGLDSYSIAALTEKQRKTMLNITKELPVLLTKLDGGKLTKETKNILSQTLSQYFLKTHMSIIL
ncbi:hypothetical protein [Prevotella pallens]|jgi:hypothetical protein|uniref:hypothetical protein n=1 Tax=Prevotella pallens TaxID=60133 RepID=UPI00288AB8FC|nr:hypothetical protein [Prevotella pallens]